MIMLTTQLTRSLFLEHSSFDIPFWLPSELAMQLDARCRSYYAATGLYFAPSWIALVTGRLVVTVRTLDWHSEMAFSCYVCPRGWSHPS